jgi:hypothetical protein
MPSSTKHWCPLHLCEPARGGLAAVCACSTIAAELAARGRCWLLLASRGQAPEQQLVAGCIHGFADPTRVSPVRAGIVWPALQTARQSSRAEWRWGERLRCWLCWWRGCGCRRCVRFGCCSEWGQWWRAGCGGGGLSGGWFCVGCCVSSLTHTALASSRAEVRLQTQGVMKTFADVPN